MDSGRRVLIEDAEVYRSVRPGQSPVKEYDERRVASFAVRARDSQIREIARLDEQSRRHNGELRSAALETLAERFG